MPAELLPSEDLDLELSGEEAPVETRRGFSGRVAVVVTTVLGAVGVFAGIHAGNSTTVGKVSGVTKQYEVEIIGNSPGALIPYSVVTDLSAELRNATNEMFDQVDQSIEEMYGQTLDMSPLMNASLNNASETELDFLKGVVGAMINSENPDDALAELVKALGTDEGAKLEGEAEMEIENALGGPGGIQELQEEERQWENGLSEEERNILQAVEKLGETQYQAGGEGLEEELKDVEQEIQAETPLIQRIERDVESGNVTAAVGDLEQK